MVYYFLNFSLDSSLSSYRSTPEFCILILYLATCWTFFFVLIIFLCVTWNFLYTRSYDLRLGMLLRLPFPSEWLLLFRAYFPWLNLPQCRLEGVRADALSLLKAFSLSPSSMMLTVGFTPFPGLRKFSSIPRFLSVLWWKGVRFCQVTFLPQWTCLQFCPLVCYLGLLDWLNFIRCTKLAVLW